MSVVRRIPIRRAQLVSPFGVGSLNVGPDGTSVITAGLDHWYEREDGSTDGMDPSEFAIAEWRLQEELHVDHLRLPPDYRDYRAGVKTPNAKVSVPVLRFPQWHFCASCRRLVKIPLQSRDRARCSECLAKKKRAPFLNQVRFIAMCDRGHVFDFPWKEWVHRSIAPSCTQTLKLKSTGGTSLTSVVVECECGDKRTLDRIVEADPDGTSTYLSRNLDSDSAVDYICDGYRPWLGTEDSIDCGRPVRGSLRGASNVYFAHVRSSIYLPKEVADVPAELIQIIEEPPIVTLVRLLRTNGVEATPQTLKGQYGQLLSPFSESQIATALRVTAEPSSAQRPGVSGDDEETAFRRAEYDVLRTNRNVSGQLVIRDQALSLYQGLPAGFAKVMLVESLRETRVLTGFTRVYPEDGQSPVDRRNLLRATPLVPRDDWLPAYVVLGEGIFFDFDEDRLTAWESSKEVQARVRPMISRFARAQSLRQLQPRAITPRLVLLHTFAHLLINRLTFESGYSSAALRERLYISDVPTACMAGVLIYTAAGDSEGTLGGLVRMGRPDYLEPLVATALDEATWCSADPVCMELATRSGQGPDSCNLAACHNCALVPETACEEFNRFLDRGLVIGDRGFASLSGFFG